MNNMDEISYWVYTKRAPCLFNYDNLIKRQNEEAHSSKAKPKSINSIPEVVPSPMKKKRKITLLEDDCVSLGKQQNIFFDSSPHKPMLIGKSESISDIDFNIKNTSVQIKNKKVKLQKNNQTTLHKKNKVVTSTPKVTNNLRRSLRKAQKSFNNNNQINSSFNLLNCSFNNNKKYSNSCLPDVATADISASKKRKSNEKQAGGDQVKSKTTIALDKAKRDTKMNGHFDDLSDVSGFTANYIRSTKIHANKNPRKPRRNNRKVIKQTQTSNQNVDKKMIVCNNKSMNTELPIQTVMNCSTDSDNIVNLVTIDEIEKTAAKINKSTSVLNLNDHKDKNKKDLAKTNNKPPKNRNISFNSKSSGNSRYLTRSKTNDHNGVVTRQSTRGQKDITKTYNTLEGNEDFVEVCMTKTRSSRSQRLSVQPPYNPVLVISNTEADSGETVNVGSTNKTLKGVRKKKHVPNNSVGKKRSLNKSEQTVKEDSVREKNGFSACFSDSEDEKPLKPQKFFC